MTAEGLTEALHRAFHDHWSPGESLDLYADSPLWQVQAAAVERILADRLAGVQAERDSAMRDLSQARRAIADEWYPRAESAEAERDALRERVEALADDWNAVPDYTPSAYDQGRVDQRHAMTMELLAALDADRSTDPSP